jgi:hypothetical protein
MSKIFESFTPSEVKLIISKLPNDDQETLTEFITKLLKRKSIFCGHCNTLLECSGPCGTNEYFSGCHGCGRVCYDCSKGENYDSPCPKLSSKEEIEKYWNGRTRQRELY